MTSKIVVQVIFMEFMLPILLEPSFLIFFLMCSSFSLNEKFVVLPIVACQTNDSISTFPPLSLQLKFVPALSREFRPYKPNPAPLLHICSSWGIPPNEVMMIGDSLRDDVSLLDADIDGDYSLR